jgi:dienelactone hydrolase
MEDMAELLLFHHAQGLTAGVLAFADQMREAGHTVHTPDLYGGRTFDTLDEGLAFVEEIGFNEVVERGGRATEGLSDGLVYGGFSLGVVPAQMLTQNRPGARGALFFHSCLPAGEFGGWPPGVPVQIHAKEADPFFLEEGDIDAARELVASTSQAELFLYPGEQHLFADPSLESYDPEAAAVLTERVRDFLKGL